METLFANTIQSMPGVLAGYAIAALLFFGIRKIIKFYKMRIAQQNIILEERKARNIQTLKNIGYMK